ncbi:MAG TPA: hypothetical protein VJ938_14165, partial [Acidimicrobiia bacterium]|nr:hypothetical protein [Acidimicrobiia bacterium]
MEIPDALQARIREWDRLSRWERSELGRDLRRLGMSYGEIMVHIEVQKTTLATWCRDIALTREQQTSIMARTGSRASIPRDTNRRRRHEIDGIQRRAAEEAADLIHDPFWVAGVVLYWAEGAKTRNHLSMANSDPAALRLFIAWLRRFGGPALEFVIQLHLHEGNDEAAARAHWQRIL